jgi:transposase
VLVALVVTKEEIPLGYEVFVGNKHDSKTVETIAQQAGASPKLTVAAITNDHWSIAFGAMIIC